MLLVSLVLLTSFLFGWNFFVAVQKVISSRTMWQFGIAALLLHSPKIVCSIVFMHMENIDFVFGQQSEECRTQWPSHNWLY